MDMLGKRTDNAAESLSTQPTQNLVVEEIKEEPKQTRFVDEVKIDGKTVLNISSEKMFFEEPIPRREKRSRWADPNIKQKVETSDIHFDPIMSLIGNKAIGAQTFLAITGPNPVQAMMNSQQNAENSKRPTKWGKQSEKVFNPPSLPGIARGLPLQELEYLIRLYRLDQLIKMRNLGQLEIIDGEIRSPSPEPIFDNMGVRLNTLERRCKDEMAREIQSLVDDCQDIDKKFVPPADWKNLKKSRKIFLPESTGGEYENNYAGTILGQGGEVQKRLEAKSGCKISIRGRMSHTKRRLDHDPTEQTHILIQAENDENLAKGVELVEKVLRGEPEELTQEEKNNMYTVVAFDKVLNKACENCGENGHKIWQCPHKHFIRKAAIRCEICKETSHPTRDCPMRKTGYTNFSVEAERDFNDLMKSIRDVTNETPLPNNPMSYLNFITDSSGLSGRAISNTAANPDQAAVATQSAVTTSFAVPESRKPKVTQAITDSK
jgi:splicing factor 1